MHEIGLVHEIVSIATEAAEQEGLTRISEIKLIIGEDMNVLPDALEESIHHLLYRCLRQSFVIG
jgi:Zn finger protein HypA/HybF involved in hydrogenase expression